MAGPRFDAVHLTASVIVVAMSHCGRSRAPTSSLQPDADTATPTPEPVGIAPHVVADRGAPAGRTTRHRRQPAPAVALRESQHSLGSEPDEARTASGQRAPVASRFLAGAEKLWAGTVDIEPDAKTGAHHR